MSNSIWSGLEKEEEVLWLVSWNIDGWKKKHRKMGDFMRELGVDVGFFQETWLGWKARLKGFIRSFQTSRETKGRPSSGFSEWVRIGSRQDIELPEDEEFRGEKRWRGAKVRWGVGFLIWLVLMVMGKKIGVWWEGCLRKLKFGLDNTTIYVVQFNTI